MSKYSCVGVFDEDNYFTWDVVENDTNLVIDTFVFKEDAEGLMYRLENGAAFNGFTPPFFLTRSVFAEDINDTFSRKFD